MKDLIIIGAGPGGYEAAAYAADQGMSVALVEKGALGGTCLNIGCIPTKTLLRSARALEEAKHADAYGVNCVGEPTVDWKKVQERKEKVLQTLGKGVGSMLSKSGVEVIKGHGRIVSRNSVDVDGTVYETRNIMIATGSEPAKPPIPGIDGEFVVTSTGVLQLEEVPESMVVIGGGVIGIEFAYLFSTLGAKVTVLEMLPRIAPMMDEDVAKRLMKLLKKNGVTFNLSCKVSGIDGDTVTFEDSKGKQRSIQSQCILNATGRRPVTADIGLEEMGIDFGPKGIKADEACKTNVAGIWACGDVTGRSLLAHSATREGIVAINNMVGKRDRMRYDAIPAVVYTHPEVASVGATEAELKDKGIPFRSASVPMAMAGRFLVENEGESGTVKVLADAKYGEILGVHMIGGTCGELIANAAAMIEKGLTVHDVEDVVFPHPTVSEILKIAIEAVDLS
jgi:dihydrolipoamide dehydrogenase